MSKLFGEIYKITNKINSKIYIGKAQVSCYGKTPSIGRFNQHIKIALNDEKRDDCPYLNRAIRKHNKNNFKVEVLFQLFGEFKSTELCKLEIKYGLENPCFGKDGYNCRSFEYNSDSFYGKRLEYGAVDGVSRVCFIEGCIHNKQPQTLNNFYKDKNSGVDGHRSICKDCSKKYEDLRERPPHYSKKHYEKYKKEILEKQKIYRQTGNYKEKRTEYVKKNKDKINVRERLKYKKNENNEQDRKKIQNKKYLQNNTEIKKAYQSYRGYKFRINKKMKNNKVIYQSTIDKMLKLEELIEQHCNIKKFIEYKNYTNIE